MTESIRFLILDFIWYPEESGTGIFPSVLQLLPNLQRLCIHLAWGNVSILNAGSFSSPQSISSVRTLILDKIVFDTASRLYSLLASFNNLEVINLDETGIEDANATADLVLSRQSCFPSTLELSLEGPVLEALLFPQSTVSIANLRILSILTVTDQEVITTSFIHSLIDLGHLSRLRSIHTSLYFDRPFPWAHPFFKGLSSSVEYIDISFWRSFLAHTMPPFCLIFDRIGKSRTVFLLAIRGNFKYGSRYMFIITLVILVLKTTVVMSGQGPVTSMNIPEISCSMKAFPKRIGRDACISNLRKAR
ncbi:hypothetical protein ARMGADRAFT_1029756 [Armillaria gallica]|uniref:Uncharacterized protein n=1 Tax=Armillaria gallica TaxID=47427 RepID=A0A2H3DXR1_ARMGA|nr:hypothetical protein ARMGADRAFT_1029756 [Armillaria gallica]